ncbi:hypothetical protein BSKO_10282 [Bryopsis sp. KO-2023]|nr:hypothetical protein BSKO_10282 [Bryopsis sp. KO-2023]
MPSVVSASSGFPMKKGVVENVEAMEDNSQKIKSVKVPVAVAAPKSILKNSPSPDIKQKSGPALAWQDFHGKELYSVMEFVVSDDDESDVEEVWEGEKRPCCSIM